VEALLNIAASVAKHFVRVLPFSVTASIGWVLWHLEWFLGLRSLEQALWGAFLFSAAVVASLVVDRLFHTSVALFSRWQVSWRHARERKGHVARLMDIDQGSYDLLCELVAENSFRPSFTIYEGQLSPEEHLMLRSMAADGLLRIRQSGYVSSAGAMFSVTLPDHIYQHTLASMRGAAEALHG
jgi:hypothetical protein